MKNVVKPAILYGMVATTFLISCHKDEVFNTQIPETNQQPTAAEVNGSLLFTNDTNGVIYRVSYAK